MMMSGCGFIFSIIDSIIFLPSINPFLKGLRIKLMTNYGPLYGLMIITSIIIKQIPIVPGAESPSKVFLDTGSWNKAQLVQNICSILNFSILYIKSISIFCAARYLIHLKGKAGDGVYYPQIGNKSHEKKKQHNISPISQYFPTVPVCSYWRHKSAPNIVLHRLNIGNSEYDYSLCFVLLYIFQTGKKNIYYY